MGMFAAKKGDQVQAMDTHIVMVPAGPSLVPTPIPGHPFTGIINGELSANVNIDGKPAAVVGSTADNTPVHVPIGGPSFQKPPSNKATIKIGSPTVTINGKAAARHGDVAITCNDPTDLPVGTVVVPASTVTMS